MENLVEFVTNFFLNLDEELVTFVSAYGVWVYGLLFVIIFAETGFVITPFLPGDSLLFATGALAASGILDIRIIVPLLLVAAIGGDAVNYSIGHFVGPRIFTAEDRSSLWHRLLGSCQSCEPSCHLSRDADRWPIRGLRFLTLPAASFGLVSASAPASPSAIFQL
jgi:hypothetical protein